MYIKCALCHRVPGSRSKHASILHGQYLYLLGGRNGNVPLKDFWRYNIGELGVELPFEPAHVLPTCLFSGQCLGTAPCLWRSPGMPAGAHHGGLPRRALRLRRRGRLLERGRDAPLDLQHKGLMFKVDTINMMKSSKLLYNFSQTPGESIRVQRVW